MINDYHSFIKNNFDKMKRKNQPDFSKSILIYNQEKNIVGRLHPITKDYRVKMEDCIELLTKWRNENSSTMSLVPFVSTHESTKKWLDTAVLQREDRILFMITSLDGTKIGHIGFSSFIYDEKCCEVDAVLRGKYHGYQGMMTFALNALIEWGLQILKLKKILLRVVSDNKRAIAFYQRNHFLRTNITYLPKEEGLTNKHYIEMELDIEEWKKANMD